MFLFFFSTIWGSKCYFALNWYILGVVNGPLKNEKSRKFYPSLGISHNLLKGLGISDFGVCWPHICFSIKSLHFFVSGSDFKTPVSNLPFATPYNILWLKIDFKGLPVLMYAQFFCQERVYVYMHARHF